MNTSQQNISSSKPPLYLIDGSSYLYRAYFAIRTPMSTSSGLQTKAIYGVTSMLLKVLREKQPEYIAVVWDAKGPTFRHRLYDQYKANRPPMPEDLAAQIPWVRKVVNALGLPQLELQGYEADDIIAALARKCTDREVIVVSGDKDLLQLLNGNIRIWDPMKDEVIDSDVFRERYGIEPWQWRDVLALAGDTSDNIPGIPGVGIKTAIKLIKKYGSIKELLKNLDSIKGKLGERLQENREHLDLWIKLVSLQDDLPLEPDHKFKRQPGDPEVIEPLFRELEFNRFINELVPQKHTLSFEEYTLVSSLDEVKNLCEEIINAQNFTIDTETTSEEPMRAGLVGISICIRPPRAAYIPLAHNTDRKQPDLHQVLDTLSPVLADENIKKTGQNIKYDMIVLANHGAKLKGAEMDTMIASYLLNPGRRRHNLDDLSRDILGHKMISFKEITSGSRKIKNFADVPLEKARDYSCEDVHVTTLIAEKLAAHLAEKGLSDLFHNVEMPLVSVLVHMERAGVHIDIEKLEDLGREFDQRLTQLQQEIFEIAGEEFNLNSPRQLGTILFEKLKLPQQKKTKKKTGYSTDVEVLKKLAELHPLPEKMLIYRNLAKLKSTYVDGLEAAVNPETGRIHTSYNQTVTATGRLSSSNPNLQNIPVKTDEGKRIRKLFAAPKGRMLVSADYSQIDLRVLAHYSEDKALVEAFRNGEDIHSRTASEIFGVMPEMVTPEMRRAAKTVNFGIVYGMSAFGLAKELNISRKEAAQFMERYFERYPGVKRYMHEIVKQARKNGFVTTLLGRRRYLPDIAARQKNIREFAERTAINTPIQGTAADIIKLAMIKCHSALKRLFPDALMVLQVHDELVIEADERDTGGVTGLLKDIMENIIELKVPLKVSAGHGCNWAELKS